MPNELWRSEQPIEDRLRHSRAQSRLTLEQARDVGKILLPLARSTRLVQRRPRLSLKDVLDTGDGECQTQDVALRCPVDEILVARVRLNLDPQVAARSGHIDAVLEAIDVESLFKRFENARYIHKRDDEIEIQADDRVGVCVHPLAADHAELRLRIA